MAFGQPDGSMIGMGNEPMPRRQRAPSHNTKKAA
jgi:hypothetical protein